MYRNNSIDAVLECERQRTGNYGNDEDLLDNIDYEDDDWGDDT